MIQDVGLLVFRVSVSMLMAFGHGWDKLLRFSERSAMFPDPLHIGSPFSLALVIFAEFFCCVAIALGILSRYAAIPPFITMLVAAFIIHAQDPWQKQEFAALYAVCFLAIMLIGPGRLSFDSLIRRRQV